MKIETCFDFIIMNSVSHTVRCVYWHQQIKRMHNVNKGDNQYFI